MRIEFTNLKRNSDSHFSLTVSDGTSDQFLEFEVQSGVSFGTDLIAHAMSTIAGRKYSEIHFDFPVSDACLGRIAEFTLCRPTSSSNSLEEVWDRDENRATLSFSGGFDSLAALALMPEDSALVTMEFGGPFEREKQSYRHFSPITVSTNLIETNLRSNSWSFMGIGAILSSKHTRSRYLCFGGILDQSPEAFQVPSPLVENKPFPAFSSCGYLPAPYVIGITEVGTANIISRAFPKIAKDSLESLADPVSEKMCRKLLLLKHFGNRLGIDMGLGDPIFPEKPPYKFGQSMVADTMSFWFTKNFGIETAQKMVADLPEDIEEFSERLGLNFYYKYNPEFYKNFPPMMKKGLIKRLEELEIDPYSQEDRAEFNEVANALSRVRKIHGRS